MPRKQDKQDRGNGDSHPHKKAASKLMIDAQDDMVFVSLKFDESETQRLCQPIQKFV